MSIILAVHPVFVKAEEEKEITVRNHISMGDIHIRLDIEEPEYGRNIGNRTDDLWVIPGEKIEKTVKVTNLARETWIRVQAEAGFSSGTMILDNSLFPQEAGWIRKGNYYYWPHPVSEGKSVTFLKSIRIPPSWGSEAADKAFSVSFTAEAVQTDHFTPHFNEEDPWFGTVIEECVHSDYTGKKTASAAFTVVYKGGAEGLVKTGDDFFAHWTDLMPGDVETGTVKIRNNYKYPVRLYFSQEASGLDELAGKLTLTIKTEDKVIFDGLLSESCAGVFLGEFTGGSGTTLTYTLKVPAQLTNTWALRKSSTMWIFEARLQSTPEEKPPVRPSTGDSSHLYLYLSLVAVSGLTLCLCLRKKRRKCTNASNSEKS